jgi:chorismate mutase/prephenate dehydratase
MADDRREREELRQKQSQIDLEILTLLARRAALSKEWGRAHEGAAPIEVDPIEAVLAAPRGEFPEQGVRSVFREIQAACRSLEARVRVAYLGLEGGPAHQAALDRFGKAELSGALGISETLDLVTRQRADFAVVPLESSSEGPHLTTLLALRPTELKIVAIQEVSGSLCLLNKTGNLQDIDKVFATAADRAAAQRYLAEHLAKAVLLDVRSPQSACELAAEDHGAAALALESVAARTSLAVVAHAVSDDAESRIFYGVVSSRPASRSGKDATVVIVGVNNEPGALFEVLKHFAERGVNLRKIQSRPSDTDSAEYLFFIEVTGHVTDRPLVTALEAMKKSTRSLKVLGSYAILGEADLARPRFAVGMSRVVDENASP